MPIADRPVPLIQQGVERDLVCTKVRPHLLERPRRQGVQLQQTGAGFDLEDVQVSTVALLGPATARDDGLGVEFLVCATTWLDLDEVIVRKIVRLPEPLAVLDFEIGGCLTVEGLVDLEGDVVVVLDLLGQIQRLLEVVQRIDKNQRYGVALSVVARFLKVVVVFLIFRGGGGGRSGVDICG